MRIGIQGIGLLGGFGCGVGALRAALDTATAPCQPFSFEQEGVTDSLPCYRAAVTGLDKFIPKRELRRIDHFSKMTLLGAHLALADAGLLTVDLSGLQRSRIGVVVASGYGPLKTTFNFLDSYLDFGYACSSPTHFSNSVHNAAAAHVSMQLKLTAPNLTVTQFEMSVPSALMTAGRWLAEGRVDQVLFGAVDEYCEVLRYCRQQFFGDGETGPMQPLDFSRQSAIAGEGAAFLLLTRGDQGAVYGYIDSVMLGNHQACPVQLPQSDLLILGADGHRECGHWYAQTALAHRVASYTSLYGSFPAAAAFDLAVAAVTLREGRGFAQPKGENSMVQDGAVKKLAYLKFGAGGDYGLVCLSG